MPTLSSTTSMKDWMPGWTIIPGYALAENVELTPPPPPPPATGDIFKEQDTLEDMLLEETESIWTEELQEDLAMAREALEEYEATGIEGIISYSEYRAKRLGSES